jgi:8-oxo-dGTP pyrophosphatase MutT (NUDIX family)
LTRAGIIKRLAGPVPAFGPEDRHIVTLPQGTPVTLAAVLVPLVHRAGEVQLLFTQRTSHLDDHAGQISFPGGRVEAGDTSREQTALRETEEEIGLSAASITLLGRLPDHEMPSGFRITPVVGWIEAPFTVKPDPYEVAEIFEVPLEHFLKARNYQRREYRFKGRHRHYMAIPHDGRYIWGATAAILYNLCRVLRSER